MPTCMFMKHNRCNVVAMHFIRKLSIYINLHPCPNQIRNYCPWIKEERIVDLSDVGVAGSLPLTA